MQLIEMEKYAKENNVPIIEKDSIDYIKKYIKENKVKSILELGTAIGYSTIHMALVSDDIHITSIERDEKRFEIAEESIKEYNLTDRVELINKDILDINLFDKYDLIFIDAAKSQYINFFNKFKENLSDNGVFISDNLGFHGLVETDEYIPSRNVRGLVRKITNYIDFLKDNEEFETEFIDIGDKMGVSKKKTNLDKK